MVYAKNHITGKREVAYVFHPKKKFVGNLVQYHYQNGIHKYKGRVDKFHQDEGRVDISYFDGDVSILWTEEVIDKNPAMKKIHYFL